MQHPTNTSSRLSHGHDRSQIDHYQSLLHPTLYHWDRTFFYSALARAFKLLHRKGIYAPSFHICLMHSISEVNSAVVRHSNQPVTRCACCACDQHHD